VLRTLSSLILFASLFGCASQHTNVGVLTVAVVGERVFIGTSNTTGISGIFRLTTIHKPVIDCTGRFRYTAFPRGRAYFQCSNNEEGSVRIEADGNLTGKGKGDSSLGPVQIAYGYSIDKMNDYLTFPDDERLVVDEGGIKLDGGSLE
jgi:hypothetical protein